MRKAKHLDVTTIFTYSFPISCKHSSRRIRARVLAYLFYNNYYRFSPWPALKAVNAYRLCSNVIYVNNNNNNNNNKHILGKINIFGEKFSESNARWKPYYDQHSVGHISKTKINSISFSNVYVRHYIFLINRSRELSHTLITQLPRTRFDHIPRYRFSFFSLWVIDLKPK